MADDEPFISRGPITAFLKDSHIEVQHIDTIRKYELLPDSLCNKCSAPLSSASEPLADPSLCYSCNVYDDLYGFDQAFAMAVYIKGRKGDLEIDIKKKYYNNRNGGARIGVALALFIQQFFPDFLEAGAIIPAPIHPVDKEKRGFNQTEVMAEEVGGLLGIPVRGDVLMKVKEGAQMQLATREERKQNVLGMYEHVPFDEPPKWVVLLDDLMSSGFTASECSQQLLEAGTELVYVLAAGRNVFAGESS